MRASVDRRDVEPRILLVEKRDVLVVLHDLNRMRPADGAHQAERQARTGVVAFFGVVAVPLLLSPSSVRKLACSLAARFILGDVGHARTLPHATEIGLAAA